MSELTAATIKKLKVAELKEELSKRSSSITGKKNELTSRLLDLVNHGLDRSVANEDSDAGGDSDATDTQENGEGEPKDVKMYWRKKYQ